MEAALRLRGNPQPGDPPQRPLPFSCVLGCECHCLHMNTLVEQPVLVVVRVVFVALVSCWAGHMPHHHGDARWYGTAV
jgi:hypothetical protein